jgi:4-hydroxy-3-polyprenylbenzoate decarboxylase
MPIHEPKPRPITLALTGASGMPYAFRLLECMLQADREVFVLCSQAARVVVGLETDIKLPLRTAEMARFLGQRYGARDGQIRAFGEDEWTAPVASGSGAMDAMVICPCTMGTLAGVRIGSSDNLIERAADVAIKEGRKLILVPRETPLSAIHLDNMLALARLGVVILPPCPGFYFGPMQVGDMVDFVVGRILDHLGVEHAITPRWGDAR